MLTILAGYKVPEMKQFFDNKLGISSRIAHRIDFPDYTINELLAIARIFLEAKHYRFSSNAETAFRDYLAQTSMPQIANAWSLRNALDQARMRQANRLLAKGGKSVTKKDLMTIESEDIEREPGIQKHSRWCGRLSFLEHQSSLQFESF